MIIVTRSRFKTLLVSNIIGTVHTTDIQEGKYEVKTGHYIPSIQLHVKCRSYGYKYPKFRNKIRTDAPTVEIQGEEFVFQS